MQDSYLDDVQKRALDFVQSRESDMIRFRERLNATDSIVIPTKEHVRSLHVILDLRKEEYFRHKDELDAVLEARSTATGHEWLQLTKAKKQLEKTGVELHESYMDAKSEYDKADHLLRYGPVEEFVRKLAPCMIQDAQSEIEKALETIHQVDTIKEGPDTNTRVLDRVDLTMDESDEDE